MLISPTAHQFENLVEHRGPISLHVRGLIPSWASGSLYRTGPGVNMVENVAGEPDGVLRISHWFDGLAHTHRFDILPDPDTPSRTQVVYSSRRQCDDWIEHVQKNGLSDMITFAQRADPCIGIFGKVMSSWKVAQSDREARKKENISVTVQVNVPGLQSPTVGLATNGGRRPEQTVWLGTDANMLRQIDPVTLKPKAFGVHANFHPSIDGPLACAHAERCPATGDYFNVNIKPGPLATYRVFRVCALSNETKILAEFSRHDLPVAYIHSFFLSTHFVVLRVPTAHIKTYGLGILWEKNILDAIVPFDEKCRCRWFVVDRWHGQGVVAEFETDAAFFFHTVNCFEEAVDHEHAEGLVQEVNVFCDVVEYPTTDILHALYYDVMLNRGERAKGAWGHAQKAENTLPRLARWKLTVPLPAPSEVVQRPRSIWSWFSSSLPWLSAAFQLPAQHRRPEPKKIMSIPTPHVGELPTINPAYRTRRHRYVYSLAMSGLSTLVDSILKTDTETREVLRWCNPRGHTPGEAIFVAQPGATREDEGALLSVVLDGTCGKSYLLCLDAETMREMGRAVMDFAVGLGFHGVHTAGAAAKTGGPSESTKHFAM